VPACSRSGALVADLCCCLQWDGETHTPHTNAGSPGVPKDSLSLPRDISFAADGRLEQRYAPELWALRQPDSHERLPPTKLRQIQQIWLKTQSRRLEVRATFAIAGGASDAVFGLRVLASPSLAEYTEIGVDLKDDVAYVDRSMSSGTTPLVA
jgi:hypothetical protein